MADTKQTQLNGAYYGPAIPPQSHPPRQHSHGVGRRCCCCLFSFCWKLILAIVVFVVLFFLIFWAVVQPHSFRLHVTDAKLTQFNYKDNNSTLYFNLVLNFTARNPNKKLGIYYDQVEAHVSYDDVSFASADVITWRNAFRQHTKSTDKMSGVFVGQHVMVLDKDQKSKFEKERKDGVFDIYVRLNFNFRFRLGSAIGGGTNAKADCELEVPLSSKRTTVFQPTQCHVSL